MHTKIIKVDFKKQEVELIKDLLKMICGDSSLFKVQIFHQKDRTFVQITLQQAFIDCIKSPRVKSEYKLFSEFYSITSFEMYNFQYMLDVFVTAIFNHEFTTITSIIEIDSKRFDNESKINWCGEDAYISSIDKAVKYITQSDQYKIEILEGETTSIIIIRFLSEAALAKFIAKKAIIALSFRSLFFLASIPAPKRYKIELVE